MDPIFRPATLTDAPALAILKRDTFRQTFLEDFSVPYPADDLRVYEAAAYGLDQVTRELRDPTHRTWIAEQGGVLLGYAHAGPCKLPHPECREGEGELYQLYVMRQAQGQSLGGKLLNLALSYLEQNHAGAIWIGVWSGNSRAQAIYAAHGFSKVGEYFFPVGSWSDHEFIYCRAPRAVAERAEQQEGHRGPA